MKNPFLDFKNAAVVNKEIPLGRIVRKNRQVMDTLLAGYRNLDPDHVKEFCRLLAHGLNFNVYKTLLSSMELPKFLASILTVALAVYESSLKQIQAIQAECKEFSPHAIEELCAFTGLSEAVAFERFASMGLYITALINTSKERCFKLNTRNYDRRLHFLGFRLKEGKLLTVSGDLGHFTGAGLNGGDLEVIGSTGSWCGADMTSGRIKITGDARSKTGEQMKGGQIQVYGRIQEIAKFRSGGEIQSKNCDDSYHS